jgi:hypothetical protein
LAAAPQLLAGAPLLAGASLAPELGPARRGLGSIPHGRIISSEFTRLLQASRWRGSDPRRGTGLALLESLKGEATAEEEELDPESESRRPGPAENAVPPCESNGSRGDNAIQAEPVADAAELRPSAERGGAKSMTCEMELERFSDSASAGRGAMSTCAVVWTAYPACGPAAGADGYYSL